MAYIEQKNLSMESLSKSIGVSDEFKDYLEHISIDEDDMYNIEYLLNFFSCPQDPSITSKSLVLYGNPGVGKTFFAEKILFELNKEILYVACRSINHPRAINCGSIKEVFSKINNSKDQVIFIDDLSYLFTLTQYGESKNKDKRELMKLLELVKNHSNKILILTMNSLRFLDDQLIDRIEMIVHVDIPDQYQKQQFLRSNYKKYLTSDLQEHIAHNSIGYNYRDLPELIKLAYRIGNHQITRKSVKEALCVYHPTQLYGFHVENSVLDTLDDVIGKKKPLQTVRRVVAQYKNQSLYDKLGLERSNVLLFHGPPGTGKSFMTRALAGEIQFPLIHVSSSHFHGRDPFSGVHRIIDMANRYQRCVILIDEAEKMIGNDRFGDDNPILGELHRCLDGGDGSNVQSVFVFAINDLNRFGNTLLDRFTLIEFKLPSFDERLEYFKKKIKKVSQDTNISFKDRDLAFRSDKMSFREMDRFWNDLMYTQLEGGKNPMEEACLNRRNNIPNEVMYG